MTDHPKDQENLIEEVEEILRENQNIISALRRLSEKLLEGIEYGKDDSESKKLSEKGGCIQDEG